MGGQGTRTRDPVPDDVLADSADLGAFPVGTRHHGLAWRGQPVFMIPSATGATHASLAYQGSLQGRLRAPIRSDSLPRFQDAMT
jgi:hypothetical protein